jgi:ABC-2 type transport system ATP-binding protein
MDYIVETQGLVKSYKEKTVVDNVNLHVKKGEIYGFVGPNGAGKSTILKMLLNLIKPDEGNIKIFNNIVSDNNVELLKRIGSIIENPYFYSNLTGKENLELHCEYMGFYNKKEIEKTLKVISLQESMDKKVSYYSLGMKQRLAIGRAIITKPELLILDEPINSLDPDGIREMRHLFKRLNTEYGTTIIISSHILSEMELLADTVGILKEGKLLIEIPMEDIHEINLEYIVIEINDSAKAGYLLEEKLGVHKFKIVSGTEIRIFDPNLKGSKISDLMIQNGLKLDSIYKKKNNLEEFFFSSLGEDTKE